MLAFALPEGHGNVDDYLANPTAWPLPDWHPTLESLTMRRARWRPGHILMFIVTGVLAIMFLASTVHKGRKWRNARQQAASAKQLPGSSAKALPVVVDAAPVQMSPLGQIGEEEVNPLAYGEAVRAMPAGCAGRKRRPHTAHARSCRTPSRSQCFPKAGLRPSRVRIWLARPPARSSPRAAG
jgi:hypothetical protein